MAYSEEYLNKLADELNEDIDFDIRDINNLTLEEQIKVLDEQSENLNSSFYRAIHFINNPDWKIQNSIAYLTISNTDSYDDFFEALNDSEVRKKVSISCLEDAFITASSFDCREEEYLTYGEKEALKDFKERLKYYKKMDKKIERIEKKYKEKIENGSLEINESSWGNFSARLEQVEVYNNFCHEHLLKENYNSTKEEMKEAILMRMNDEGFDLSDFENFEELEEGLYEAGYLGKLEFDEEVREIELSAKELMDIKVSEIGDLFDNGLTPEEVDEQTKAYEVYKEALEELKEEWKQELDYKNTNQLKI